MTNNRRPKGAALAFAVIVRDHHCENSNNGLFRITSSGRALAETVGKSAGTISGYMRELDDAGIRINSEYLDPAALQHHLTVQPIRTPAAVRATKAIEPAEPSALLNSVERLLDMVATNPAQLDNARYLAAQIIELHNHTSARENADEQPESRALPASKTEQSRGLNNEGMNEYFIHSSVGDNHARGKTRGLEPAHSPRTKEQFAAIIEPLVAAAAANPDAQRMTDESHIRRQWDGYSDEHLAYAVEVLTAEAHNGYRLVFGTLHNCTTDPKYKPDPTALAVPLLAAAPTAEPDEIEEPDEPTASWTFIVDRLSDCRESLSKPAS